MMPTPNLARIQLRLFLSESGGAVVPTYTTKKRRISLLVCGEKKLEGILEVTYYHDGQKLGTNTSVHGGNAELHAALNAFTEPDLLRFLAASAKGERA